VTAGRIRAISPVGRLVTLAAGLIVTTLAWLLPRLEQPATALHSLLHPFLPISHQTSHSLVLLAFGLALTLPSRRRSGLRIGAFRANWLRVLIVCAIPVLVTAIVYPRLPVQPFSRGRIEMWLVSPLAQDLVFQGFLLGRLERSYPPRGRLRFGTALVIGATFFSAWHLQNFASGMPRAFVLFQLAYTAAGFLLTGLSRLWTGSILYATLSHSAVNFIAAMARPI
jgi:membrane protease YdiL (CAAX protease family)